MCLCVTDFAYYCLCRSDTAYLLFYRKRNGKMMNISVMLENMTDDKNNMADSRRFK